MEMVSTTSEARLHLLGSLKELSLSLLKYLLLVCQDPGYNALSKSVLQMTSLSSRIYSTLIP